MAPSSCFSVTSRVIFWKTGTSFDPVNTWFMAPLSSPEVLLTKTWIAGVSSLQGRTCSLYWTGVAFGSWTVQEMVSQLSTLSVVHVTDVLPALTAICWRARQVVMVGSVGRSIIYMFTTCVNVNYTSDHCYTSTMWELMSMVVWVLLWGEVFSTYHPSSES